MTPLRNNDDPTVPKEGEKGYVFERIPSVYPVSINKKGRVEFAPLPPNVNLTGELQSLRINPNLTDAAFEINKQVGGREYKLIKAINKYLTNSENVASYKKQQALGFDPEEGIPSISYIKGEKNEERITPLNKVVNSLGALSEEDIEGLKNEILRLSEDYAVLNERVDGRFLTPAEKMKEAAAIAANQDWSGIADYREKAGLSKSDILALIQAPENADAFEKSAYGIARNLARFKKFAKGGVIKAYKK